MFFVPKGNGDSTAVGGAAIDHVYISDSVLSKLVVATSTVIRHDDYSETADDFRRCCSDHYPVYIDYDPGMSAL